jgi:hypothetical protein
MIGRNDDKRRGAQVAALTLPLVHPKLTPGLLDMHPRLRLWVQWIHRSAMAIEVNPLASKSSGVEPNVQ